MCVVGWKDIFESVIGLTTNMRAPWTCVYRWK